MHHEVLGREKFIDFGTGGTRVAGGAGERAGREASSIL
jgi:hypothetical protein